MKSLPCCGLELCIHFPQWVFLFTQQVPLCTQQKEAGCPSWFIKWSIWDVAGITFYCCHLPVPIGICLRTFYKASLLLFKMTDLQTHFHLILGQLLILIHWHILYSDFHIVLYVYILVQYFYVFLLIFTVVTHTFLHQHKCKLCYRWPYWMFAWFSKQIMS